MLTICASASTVSVWVTVSGHAPLEATRYTVGAATLTMAGSCDLAITHPPPDYDRCRQCNRWVGRYETAQVVHTFGSPLCPSCAALWGEHCWARFGRIPNPSEFLCRSCDNGLGAIHPRIEDEPVQPGEKPVQMTPDPDGRQRWVCRKCRLRQMNEAKHRYRAKLRLRASIRVTGEDD